MRLRSPDVSFIDRILPFSPSPVQRRRAVLLLLVTLTACGSTQDVFVRERVADSCEESWPVCDQIVGCLLGNRSFREGRFPGTVRFGVTLPEPSIVRVNFLLEAPRSEGEETVLTFFEDGCRDRTRLAVPGRTFVGEAEQFGTFSREAELFAEGEHLIEITSDAQTDYLLKVDVIPKRGE